MSQHFTPITVRLGLSKQLARMRLALASLALVSVGRLWVIGGDCAWVGSGVGLGLAGWLFWGADFALRFKRRGDAAPDELRWLDPELVVPYRRGRPLAPSRLEQVTYLDRHLIVLRCRQYREPPPSGGNGVRTGRWPWPRWISLAVDNRWRTVHHWVLVTDAIGAPTAHRVRRALRQWGPKTDSSRQ